MQALLRAGLELAENRPLAELFPVILDLAIQAVNAQRGVLMTLEGGELVPRAHKGEGFRISTAVRDRVMRERASMLVRDAQLDDAFKGRMSIVEQKVHTMMAVPLQTKERIIGLIYVDSPFVLREFTKDDLSLLTVMANVAAIRIENARLAEIEEADRIIAARSGARRPKSSAACCRTRPPQVAGRRPGRIQRRRAARWAATTTTSSPTPAGRVGLALGDVSGKGMPASLMMMALHARVQVLAEDPGDLAAFMTRLNKATCVNCPGNRFITFFFCVLDARHGRAGLRQRGPQSARDPARFRRGGDAGGRRPACWAFCPWRPTARCARNWSRATCWRFTATA